MNSTPLANTDSRPAVPRPEAARETAVPPAIRPEGAPQTTEACNRGLSAIQDTLYVLGGKWKLPIIITLFGGPQRFRELQRSLESITPKVLSKELKQLELNEFITRTVYPTTPVTVEYQLTEYSRTLGDLLRVMRDWGEQHRARLQQTSRTRRAKRTAMAAPAITSPPGTAAG
jgi:DNA-binding HxlR family transcriptional regulator